MLGRQFFLGDERILPQVTQDSRDKTELRGKEVVTSCQPKPPPSPEMYRRSCVEGGPLVGRTSLLIS